MELSELNKLAQVAMRKKPQQGYDPDKRMNQMFRQSYMPENPDPALATFQKGLTAPEQPAQTNQAPEGQPAQAAQAGQAAEPTGTPSGYLARETWEEIMGAKDVSDLIKAFTPKPKEEQIKYSQRMAKMKALGNALGSIGGMISANMGGPVQEQDHKGVTDHLEKVAQHKDHYLAEQRAHEMMMLQNEIANRKGYGQHVLQQLEKDQDFQKQSDLLKAKWLREDEQTQQKQDHALTMQEKKDKAAAERAAAANATRERTTAAANASRERAAATRAAADKDKNTKTWKIYDPKDKNKVLHELDDHQKFRLEEIVITDLIKELEAGKVFDRRTTAVLEERNNISAEDRWMLAQRYANRDAAKDFLESRDTAGERAVRNKGTWGMAAGADTPEVRAMRSMAAKRLTEMYEGVSLAHAEELVKGASPDQIRYIINQ
jgi:hypothetical protein